MGAAIRKIREKKAGLLLPFLLLLAFFIAGASAFAKTPSPGAPEPKFDPDTKEPIGPLSRRAATRRDGSVRSIDEQRGTSADLINQTPPSAAAPSSAPLYNSALDTANTATANANALAAAAAARRAEAEAERQRILENVAGRAQTGELSQNDVNRFRQLFRETPHPTEAQIRSLPEPLHDAATALRMNHEEQQYLRDTSSYYSNVARGTGDMGRHLSGLSDRAGTISSSSAAAARGPVQTASRGAAGSGSGNGAGGSRRGESGSDEPFKIGAGGGKGAGAVKADAEKDKDKAGVLAGTGGPGAPGADAKKDGKAGEKGPLNEEGKALLAAMMKELKGDLADTGKPGDTASLREKEKSLSEFGLENTDEHTAIGSAILSVKKSKRAPSAVGVAALEAEKSMENLGAPDYLGIDKSLFTRVHECTRRKWAPKGGIQ